MGRENCLPYIRLQCNNYFLVPEHKHVMMKYYSIFSLRVKNFVLLISLFSAGSYITAIGSSGIEHDDIRNTTIFLLQIFSFGIVRNLLVLDYTYTEFEDDPNNPNVLFAPLNIYKIIGALMLGSAGNTAIELNNFLNLTTTFLRYCQPQVWHKEVGEFLSQLEPTLDISTTTGVFVQENYSVSADYIKLAKNIYNTEVCGIDFLKDEATATNFINQWVSKKTRGRVRKIYKEPANFSTELMALGINVFKGDWKYPFSSQYMNWELFHLHRKGAVAKESILVQMMTNRATILYYNDSIIGYETIGIPLKSEDSIMYITLPNVDANVKVLAATIDRSDLDNILNRSQRVDTCYKIPKMKLEMEYDVKDSLQKINVKDMFDRDKANFANLLSKEHSHGSFASNIIHKVWLDVSETKTIDSHINMEGCFHFTVDRPFFFFVFNSKFRLITFWGTIHKPSPRKAAPKMARLIYKEPNKTRERRMRKSTGVSSSTLQSD